MNKTNWGEKTVKEAMEECTFGLDGQARPLDTHLTKT